MEFNDEQLKFCARVRQAPREIDLRSLLDLLVQGQSGLGMLQRLGKLDRVLALLGFQASPGVSEGGLDSMVLVSTKMPGSSADHVHSEIASGESQQVEFKSTFSCCLRTLRTAKPGLDPKHFKKPEVEDSCLSAFAGMLNSRGGVVLIGVEDDGNVVGLEPDLLAMGVGNPDRWQGFVRSKIERWFMDGRTINPLIEIGFVEVHGHTVARAVVQPRPKLAFLLDPLREACPPRLLCRVGNRTSEIKPADLEEFFETRSRGRAPY